MTKDKILDPNYSIWVNASAGTGKTKLLIDRVLRLMLSGKKNILCLTFTNSAVQEMKDRIFHILGCWVLASDEDLRKTVKLLLGSSFSNYHIEKARILFTEIDKLNLNIQTIHSFCYQIISRFPIESGITPNHTINNSKSFYKFIIDKVLRHKIVYKELKSLINDINENNLVDLLDILLDHTDSGTYELLTTSALDYTEIFKNIENIKQLSHNLLLGSIRDQKLGKVLQKYSKIIDSKNYDADFDEYFKIFINLDNFKAKDISLIVTKNTLKQFPNVAEIIYQEQNNILSYIEQYYTNKIINKTNSLINIYNLFYKYYTIYKQKNYYIDYSDIIKLLLKLVTVSPHESWILFNLDHTIDHILVDESQDNSLKQWLIIDKLTQEFFVGDGSKDQGSSLFVVGDVKQSIYSFQNAMPEYFIPMCEYFSNNNHNNWVIVENNKSYRSTPQILKLVDLVFNIFRQEISFSDNEIKHEVHRQNEEGYVELWPLISVSELEDDEIEDVDNYINGDDLLARTIATKIKIWLDTKRCIKAKKRAITAKDIIILVRHRNQFISHLKNALKLQDIPVSGEDNSKLLNNLVIRDLINLAEFVLLPSHDLFLANLLKSPLFSFDEESLFKLCYNRQNILLDELKIYHKNIFDCLQGIIKLAGNSSVLEFFSYIIKTYANKFILEFGITVVSILEEFINLVVQFETENSFSSLQNFVLWIKNHDIDIKTVMSTDSVRIMTVHSAKGLQAPIVFLADTTTIPRQRDSILFEDGKPLWCGNNIYYKRLRELEKRKEYNEYLRLLYVAMTRAEDELYIVGKAPVQTGSWYDIIQSLPNIFENRPTILSPSFTDEIEVMCINKNYFKN